MNPGQWISHSPNFGTEAAEGGAVFTNINSKNMKLPNKLVAAKLINTVFVILAFEILLLWQG